MLAGDDLTIVLFFVGTAVSLACAAMSAAGWRHPFLISSLFALAAACFGFGVAWPSLKDSSPPSITIPVHQIATNPVSWFVVLILGMTAAILLPRRRNSPRETKLAAQSLQLASPEQLITSKPEESRAEEKTVIDASAEFLTGLYEGRTAVQADTLAAMYLGRWTTITGKVANVYKARSEGGHRVMILSGPENKLVTSILETILALLISLLARQLVSTVR